MPPRSTNRRNAPQSPPKPAVQASKTRRSARGHSQDLVNETIPAETSTRGPKGAQPDKSALADIAESATGQLNNYEQDEVSIAGASDAGQTVQTSYTQFANGKFDRTEMIAALADLQDDSNAFISLATATEVNTAVVLSKDSEDGLGPAERRFKGRFKGLLDTFQSSLEPYKDRDDAFINVHAAVSILSNVNSWEEVTEQDRTSEALFQLANVTELLNLTLHGRAKSPLDYINVTFPTPFFTDFISAWGGTLSDKTVELALAIRTQYFMDMLYKTIERPDFDPDYTLQSIFFNETGGLLALELTDEDGILPEQWQPIFEQRIQEIRQHFSTGESPVNIETLEEAFSWPAFRAELVQWAVIRANGLNQQITNRGGAKAFQIHLQGGPSAAPISEKKRKSVGDKARQVNEMLAELERTKARRGTPLTQINALSVGHEELDEIQESPIQTSAYAPASEHVQMDDQFPLASQQSMQVLETLRLHEAQSNKENAQQQVGRKGKFIDRQAGAHRIESFDESQYINGTPGTSRKRGREADAEDDDDSVQYVDDNRPLPGKRARSNGAQDGFAEAAFDVAADAAAADAQLLAHAAASTQPVPTRSALTPHNPRNRPPPSTAPEARQAQSPTDGVPGSQPISVPGTQSKGPQVRIPFSVEETTRLLELISGLPEGTMRISWAQLEKQDLMHPEGPLLQRRGQVGLKDKARNLKMDFIKARQPPPRNFSLIPLGNRLIDQLDRLGVPHSER